MNHDRERDAGQYEQPARVGPEHLVKLPPDLGVPCCEKYGKINKAFLAQVLSDLADQGIELDVSVVPTGTFTSQVAVTLKLPGRH